MLYDRAIFKWFGKKVQKNNGEHFLLEGKKINNLRYGENPHQAASIFSLGIKNKDRFLKNSWKRFII